MRLVFAIIVVTLAVLALDYFVDAKPKAKETMCVHVTDAGLGRFGAYATCPAGALRVVRVVTEDGRTFAVGE